MNFWRAVFLAAFLLGFVLGIFCALVALHAAFFFGVLTPLTQARMTYAIQDAAPNLFGEKLQAVGTGVSVLDEILVKAHSACPR